MVGIGINENVFIESAVLNDKDTLEISFGQVKEGAATAEMSYFESIGNDVAVDPSGSSTLRVFPPLPPKEDSDDTQERKVQLKSLDISGEKEILQHIMEQYMSSDDAKLGAVVWEGTGLDKNNFNTLILQKDVLLRVHKNLCQAFIQKMSQFFGKKENLMRLLLVRQSKDKAYATFRRNYVKDNPFMESMDIPADASKVKFTDYEKKQGLDNANPPERKTDADQNQNNTPQNVSDIFG